MQPLSITLVTLQFSLLLEKNCPLMLLLLLMLTLTTMLRMKKQIIMVVLKMKKLHKGRKEEPHQRPGYCGPVESSITPSQINSQARTIAYVTTHMVYSV